MEGLSLTLPTDGKNGTIASVCNGTSFHTESSSILKEIQSLFEHKAEFPPLPTITVITDHSSSAAGEEQTG